MKLTRLLPLALLVAGGPAFGRTWTNDEGQTLEADFVRLRGPTVYLRGEDKKLVPAPLNRLSEADQQWVERYKELSGPREWATGGEPVRGRFELVREDGVSVSGAGDPVVVPFAKLSPADWQHVEAYHTHLERDLPDGFAAKRREAKAAEPPENAPEREWTDARGRKITALYGGAKGKAALLWIQGKRYEYPLAKLSPDDRRWVAQQCLQQLMADLRGGVSAATSIGTTVAARPPGLEAGVPPGESEGEFRGEPGGGEYGAAPIE
ncbi:hypothetical protein Pla108_04880 [Botrimarina colliarenosi]|uniref:SLA1 homology domain-containing protein n=1 Tax=Botrimarina colliarenosi TaxID=2528001 RepID=A0A5C6AK53_9BACT|nr:hypothetical protein [Botrimarina colliarenosi]TWT99545.1 hypothetical protein Pla108_04880 [Botrimarina colliarenosi]